MNGGYVMLDATGVDLSADAKKTVTGLHAKIKKAIESEKPIVFYGIVNDTAKLAPVFATVEPSSTSYVVTINATTATVDSSDGVTIASLIPAPTNSKSTK